jgi:cardiolipin synthase C
MERGNLQHGIEETQQANAEGRSMAPGRRLEARPRRASCRSRIQASIGSLLFAGVVSACGVHVPSVTDALKQPFSKTIERQSSAVAKTSRIEIFTNNDVALQHKIELADKATKNLRLAYFIFSDDQSSSALAEALLRAAQRGVKVQLLVDLNNNYSRLDFYSMLEREGAKAGGSIEVRFYGRPEREFMKDVAYLTSGCRDIDPTLTNLDKLPPENTGTGNADRCPERKLAQVRAFFDAADSEYEKRMSFSSVNTGLSGLFLSGLYAKNADLLSGAVIAGQQLDVKRLKEGSSTDLSPEQKAGLIEFLKLYVKSKTASNPFVRLQSQIKLVLAGVFYGDTVNPLRNALEHYLPTDSRAGKGWVHEQDFVHHKYLLADVADFQAGGRNVENSYHMSPDTMVEKYIFMDTDIAVQLKSGGEALAQNFEDLWNYTPVVATMKEVRQFAPNDSLIALTQRKKSCATPGPACQEPLVPPTFDQRLDEQLIALQASAAAYNSGYGALPLEERIRRYHPAIQQRIVGTQEGGEVGRYTVVDPVVRVDYIENLPYLHAGRIGEPLVPVDVRQREHVWGTSLTEDTLDAKSIHRVWHHGFLNNCRGAHPNKDVGAKRILLHQAYLAFSPDMLDVLGRMVDGALDCSNVTVDIITNSVHTTDLGVIDVVGKMFMAQLFNSFSNPGVVQLGSPNRAARLRLYEYKALPSALTKNAPSLHTKVVILDENTMWVGSANMDTRSITMDTNNGLLLRDAPQLVADFTRRYTDIENDQDLVTFVADNGIPQRYHGSYRRLGKRGIFYEQTVQQFQQTGWAAMYQKFVKPRNLGQEKEAKLEQRFHDILNRLHELSGRVIFGKVVGGSKLRADQDALNELFLETTNF